MKYKTEQEEFWAGEFGLNYIDRNKSDSLFYSVLSMWGKMLRATNNIKSAREFGCNIGLNLMALKKLKPMIDLSAYEINEQAAKQAEDLGIAQIKLGSILENINDHKVDLTFTVCVLIHIHPEHLGNVYNNLVNGSNRYVLVAEYYNPKPTKIKYRGNENKLFKRDFAGDLIDDYGLNLVDYGFIYNRDNWAPQDDISWFLLEK